MRPLKRKPVDKHGPAKKLGTVKNFRRDVERTHPKNLKPVPMRGGWRM